MGPGQTMEMFIDVFIDMVQTAGVTPTILRASGQCAIHYLRARTYGSAQSAKPFLKGTLWNWLLDSQGKVLRFKDNGFQGNANVIANFETNGDIEGIYMEESFIGSWEAGTEETIFVQNGFVVDATNKVFCKKL